jgi:antitoxin (DNA-binding transcriptional repressor) of toxin-antitoxin stability system
MHTVVKYKQEVPMTQVTLEEATDRIEELIRQAQSGEEVIIMEDDQPIAQIIPVDELSAFEPRTGVKPGSAKGLILYMADDFDAPLEDFEEYMK